MGSPLCLSCGPLANHLRVAHFTYACQRCQSRLWVICRRARPAKPCLLNPQKRTSLPYTPVSATGQKLPSATAFALSATGQKSRVDCRLLDHFVRACKQCSRNVEVKRLRGLQIDYEIVLGRCLYGQIGRLLAFQNAIGVSRCQSKLVDG